MSEGKIIKMPATAGKASKVTQTKTDTILITQKTVESWKTPPFQRPLRVNEKVRALAEEIRRDGGVIPGVITLGRMGGDTYLLDGQHRIHAFLMSEADEGYADVRTCFVATFAEMGDEYVRLNSRLVAMKPDDILKGLEASTPALQLIRKRCPFVGYDQLRRGSHSPILSASAAFRCWAISAAEVPVSSVASSAQLATSITTDDAEAMATFLELLFAAWGRDSVTLRLWSSLNLSITAWLYRRTVIHPTGNTIHLTKELFKKGAMSLAADESYVDWLLGRQLGDRDRSPCYMRMKAVLAKRLAVELGKAPTLVRLPQPAWSSNSGHVRR